MQAGVFEQKVGGLDAYRISHLIARSPSEKPQSIQSNQAERSPDLDSSSADLPAQEETSLDSEL